MTFTGIGTANNNAGQYIASRTNFMGSNFYGQTQSPDPADRYPAYGMLPDTHISLLESENPSYIIYSYGTPIAWYGTYGWNIPAIKYSMTTSKHQSYVRRSI
jgi:hypothetical protein